MGACLSTGPRTKQAAAPKVVEETQLVCDGGTSSEPSSVSETAQSRENTQQTLREDSKAKSESKSMQQHQQQLKQELAAKSVAHTRAKADLTQANDHQTRELVKKAQATEQILEIQTKSAAHGAIVEDSADSLNVCTDVHVVPRKRSGAKKTKPKNAHMAAGGDDAMIFWEDADLPDAFHVLEQIHASSLQVHEEDVYVTDMYATQPQILLAA